MKRILEVCVDLDGGGIDRYLYNYCSNINDIDFDFVIVEKNKRGILEESLIAHGCNIYRIPRQKNGIRKNYCTLKKIMTQNKYDAIHIHLGYKSLIALICAKKCGIKTRIVHAHIADEPENILHRYLRKIMTFAVKKYATSLVACGIDAAKWVWGENEYNKGNITIHNNAIDTERFKYDKEVRALYRKDLNVNEDEVVYGHIGRLSMQKNQERLIDIFSEICKINSNSKLIIIGRGEKEEVLLQKVKELNLEKKVLFLGVRDDVDKLLNAMDVFVFPSLFEGLPFTLIETQCNGLHAICSDKVSKYSKVSDCIEFLSLNENDKIWAKKAVEISKMPHDISARKHVIDAGYDLSTESKKLKEFYLKNMG